MKKQHQPTISFCTTCMGRLEHLKQTLPKNMQDNADYPNCQFVVLNYGNEAETNDWIKANFQKEMDSGRLKYITYDGTSTFHAAHAKNIAHLAADGDIVCNMDADQYTGKNFAQFVADTFTQAEKEKKPIFLRHDTFKFTPEQSELYQSSGKIAMRKSDFLRLRGYDENITGWGLDDTELVLRMRSRGIKQTSIPVNFASGINHSDELRVTNFDTDDREMSIQRLEKLGRERDSDKKTHRLSRLAGKVGRAIPLVVNSWVKQINPHGFGVAKIDINFADEHASNSHLEKGTQKQEGNDFHAGENPQTQPDTRLLNNKLATNALRHSPNNSPSQE